MFTPGHTVTGRVHVFGQTDLAAFVDSTDPRFVPVTEVTTRSLADRRIVSHYAFVLINRTQMIAAAEAGVTGGVEPDAIGDEDIARRSRRGAVARSIRRYCRAWAIRSVAATHHAIDHARAGLFFVSLCIASGSNTERAQMASFPTPVARFRKPAALLIAGALALSLSGAVGAATPPDGNLIKACVDKTTKVTRVTIYASPTWCRSTESYKFWSKTGPVGPKGATGNAGTNGTNGTNGRRGRTAPGGTRARTGSGHPRHERATMAPRAPTARQGDDGESAFQVRGRQRLRGTLSEWLASLKGAEGTNGTDGTNGDRRHQRD